MHIAIVEDETAVATQLQEYITRFAKESEKNIEMSHYSSGVEFLNRFKGQFDIILMDIVMPGIDGMETARRLRQIDPQVALLFLTNMAQYAVSGYEVEAADYILKPVSYFVFSQRLARAISRLDRQGKHYLIITCKTGARKLEIESIYYVESQGHNLIYHTSGGTYTVLGTIRNVEDKLSPFHFFRCNKGILVSLAHVDGIDDGCAVVAGEGCHVKKGSEVAFEPDLRLVVAGVVYKVQCIARCAAGQLHCQTICNICLIGIICNKKVGL